MKSENGSESLLNVRYPRTPYWPWSPTIGRGDDVHANPDRFIGEDVVVTEKLDGGNTLLHAGRVYARSVSAPSDGKWMAMVKKHHAWKVHEPDVYLYGEDIYGVHSIAYGPVAERETFRAFGCGSSSWTVFAPIHRGLRSRTVPFRVVLRGSGVGPSVHRLTFAQADRLNPPGRFGSVPRQRAGLDIRQAFW